MCNYDNDGDKDSGESAPWRDEDTLREMLVDRGKSASELSREWGCDYRTISRNAEEFGIGAYECPTCGDTFVTLRGRNTHHGRVHGESIAGVTVECDVCGTEKTVAPDRLTRYEKHYCGPECQTIGRRKRTDAECHRCGDTFEIAEWHLKQSNRVFCPEKNCYGKWLSEHISGENHPNWVKGPRTTECDWCGTELERRPEHVLDPDRKAFCSNGADSCEQKWKQEYHVTGEEHPLYNRVEVDCGWCGNTLKRKPHYVEMVGQTFCDDTDCHKKWYAENFRGENNPNWAGGHRKYGPGWNESKKELVRERDGHKCVECGRPEQTHIELFGMKQPVHHIARARDVDHPPTHNAPENLVTLCADGCHQKWEKFSPLRPDTR